jgi:hypothetical protein
VRFGVVGPGNVHGMTVARGASLRIMADPKVSATATGGGWRVTTTELSARNVTLLLAAYLRAVERFRAQDHASEDRAEDGLRAAPLAEAALFEALNWADMIDDYLARGPRGTVGTPRDPQWADKLASDDADLVHGLRIARNVVHHQWTNAVSTVSAPNHTSWIWSPLPDPGRARTPAAQAQAAAHARRVEGRSIVATLDDLSRVLWNFRRWTIDRDSIEQPGHTIRSPIAFDDEQSVSD